MSVNVSKLCGIMIAPKEHPEMFRVLFYLLTTSEGCVPGFFLSTVRGRVHPFDEKAVVGADEPLNKDPAIEAFYSSWTWREFRKSFMESRHWLCERCCAKGLIVPAEHVHHKIPITPENLKDPAITLNRNNVEALCANCHQEAHKKKRWRCDPDGHVRL